MGILNNPWFSGPSDKAWYLVSGFPHCNKTFASFYCGFEKLIASSVHSQFRLSRCHAAGFKELKALKAYLFSGVGARVPPLVYIAWEYILVSSRRRHVCSKISEHLCAMWPQVMQERLVWERARGRGQYFFVLGHNIGPTQFIQDHQFLRRSTLGHFLWSRLTL